MNIRMRIDDKSLDKTEPKSVRNLERLDVERLCGRIVVYNPPQDQISDLINMARKDLPQLADVEVVRRIVAHNPDSFWAIQKKSTYSAGDTNPTGFVALLLLNDAGIDALLTSKLDRANPPQEFLVGQHEKPSGVYVWTLHAKGRLAVAVSLVRDKVCSRYPNMPIFGLSVNSTADHFMRSLGYTKGVWWEGKYIPEFYHFQMDQKRTSNEATSSNAKMCPPYNSYQPQKNGAKVGSKQIGITVAHNIEDIMKVMSVRAAVYIGEQECPYLEEYDGNDFASTHLLGYMGDEPAGCMRIRYFANFAKIERLAVRREFRRSRLSWKLVRAGIELCRSKGYRRLYGHSQKRLVNFWGRFGFQPIEDTPEFVFSDFDYVEISADIEPHPEAVNIGSDPYLIIRPEGCWDSPGVLEISNARPVTNPSVNA